MIRIPLYVHLVLSSLLFLPLSPSLSLFSLPFPYSSVWVHSAFENKPHALGMATRWMKTMKQGRLALFVHHYGNKVQVENDITNPKLYPSHTHTLCHLTLIYFCGFDIFVNRFSPILLNKNSEYSCFVKICCHKKNFL